MYLKSVEIVGYKSFAAKTRLELEPGITGIIGPNGCGKSNIMESVRWCLGEMSWKSLRADSMVDVIFAGTAKRAPLSMTEVTLVFDNAQNKLPVQFSEVTVSRKIFRSGESEYYLNKTQCRLRDIRELFLDTGIGGDGYAIIDQGGVDFVLSSKPEDRRSLFEEAAGVAKYKAKREEALRKLERVEADMMRLQDSVSLIEEQVKKLDSDARKAKLFKKYKEELSSMEAAHILRQMGSVEIELAALSALVHPVEERLGERRVAMSAEGANLAAFNLERANQQNQVIACNQKVSEVKSQIGRLEERLVQCAQALIEIEQRRGHAEAELYGARERQGSIDPEMDRASTQLAEAQAQLGAARAEVDNWKSGVDKIESELAEANLELESLRQETFKTAQEGIDLRRKMTSLESSWTRHEAQVRQNLRGLEKDLAYSQTCEKDIETSRAALAEQEARAAASQDALSGLEAGIAELRGRQSALGDDAMRLHADLAGARAKAESVKAHGEQNPYWAGAQAVINAALPGVIGTVRQLIRVADAHKALLEDALGERLYAVVCEDSTAARAAVEYLEASGKGRARFLVLSTLAEPVDRSYPEEAKPLISLLSFDPAHEKAVRYLLQESYTLGKILFGDHWIYGGSPARESLHVTLSEIGEFEAQIAAMASRQSELSGQKSALQAELSAAESQARQAASSLTEESAKKHSIKAQVEEKQASLENSRKNVEIATEDASRTLAEMAVTKEEIYRIRAQTVEIDGREKFCRESEQAVAQKIGAIREELARVKASQDALIAKVSGFEQQASFHSKDFERLAMEKERLTAAAARLEQEIVGLVAKKDDATLREKEARQQLEVLALELKASEQESLGVVGRLQELDKAVSEKEAVLRQLKEESDKAQAELHQYEVQASAHKSRQDLLKTRLWDDWQLTYEEARQKYSEQPVDTEKIESLRKRLANMGNVNMAAPEEYEALSSKQTFLATQIADLSKAKEDLMSAIQKINGSTRENFRQTFMEVREQFRRLYGVLFEGGGEADLILTDPENILETGIDIVAQPPGKRLQSISLLSGGEKTLTAIALLFAFFMVKPSPFCMLDEADAALDEANVERFVSLLKEFRERSQFLVVSHNKRTMEAADVIYGVTMEELGVSQLISVDFRKKSDKPAADAAAAAPETASDAASTPAA